MDEASQGHPRHRRVVHQHGGDSITSTRSSNGNARSRLANLAKIYAAVGDRVTIVMVTGTDFGARAGRSSVRRAYRKLFMPFHRRVNDWIHQHTPWKTFIHSCGSIVALLPDIVAAGFDALNPVQCSAVGMDPQMLKDEFGAKVEFWGGGVDTQKTLPFGTPDQVRQEVRQRIEIFGPGGGFVFNTVHNVQAATPTANLVALYEAVRESRGLGKREAAACHC